MSRDLPSYDVALLKWEDVPGDYECGIRHELEQLGHRVTYFRYDEPVPGGVDVVFSFAAFRRFLQVPRQLSRMPAERRPTFVHWNTEGLVNLHVPYRLASALCAVRSGMGRISDSFERMRGAMRFGDYRYAARRGWLDVFADISSIYARRFTEHGIPTIYAPFGASPLWHADLELRRDVDVLWMGMRGTRRRSRILARLEEDLDRRGVRFHVADGVRNPFVFGRARTELLNRAKITVNVLRTWWSENSLRLAMAAPNRSLVISEELLPHVPAYVPGVHYVATPVEKLADTIVRYLGQEPERLRIVDAAQRLVTTELTFAKSIARIMDAVRAKRERDR